MKQIISSICVRTCLCIAFVFTCVLSRANQLPGKIKFCGTIQDVSTKEVNILINKTVLGGAYNNIFGYDTLKSLVKNNRFEIESGILDHPGYLTFFEKDGDGNFHNQLNNYIYFPGDSITIKISDKSIDFSGKGAIRYQYLYSTTLLGNQEKFPNPYPISWLDKKIIKTWQTIDTTLENFHSNYSKKLTLLNQLRNDLSNEEISLLGISELSLYKKSEMTLISSVIQPNLKDWRFNNIASDFVEFSNKVKKRDAGFDSLFNKLINSNPSNLLYCEDYLAYRTTEATFRLKMDGEFSCNDILPQQDHNSGIRQLYGAVLSQDMDPALKEKLLARVVLSYQAWLVPEQYAVVLNYASVTIKNNSYRNIFAFLKQGIAPVIKGATIGDYSFIDMKGNDVKLSDFKNKVVLVDLWFSGCGACQHVAKAMPKVETLFEGNSDVVFLSVSIDPDEKVWLKSIDPTAKPDNMFHNASLYYSGLNTVYWKLKGDYKVLDEAANSPFLKTYVPDNGYPTLFLIGKNGKFYMKNPPRPDAVGGVESLAEVIKRALAFSY